MGANNGISTDLALIHLFEEGDDTVLERDGGERSAISESAPASAYDVQKLLEMTQFVDIHLNIYGVLDDDDVPRLDRSDIRQMREQAQCILRAAKWAYTELPGFVETFCCSNENCNRTRTLYRHQNGDVEGSTFEYRRVVNGDPFSPVFDTEADAREWIIDMIAQTNVRAYDALKAVRELWLHNQDMTQRDVRDLFDGIMSIDPTHLALVDPRPGTVDEASDDEWIEAIHRAEMTFRERDPEAAKFGFLRQTYNEFRSVGDPRLTFDSRISTQDWIDFKRFADEMDS